MESVREGMNQGSELMTTKDSIGLGIPLGEATWRAMDFVAKFILGGGSNKRVDHCVKHVSLCL